MGQIELGGGGVFAGFAPERISVAFQFFAAVAAIICFGGGVLRLLYAAIFEEGATTRQFGPPSSYAAPMMPTPAARPSLLPQSNATPTIGWRPQPQTAEIRQPPSVTDHTTRLLEKREPDPE